MDVGAADPAGLDPDEDFSRSGLRPRDFFHHQRFSNLIKMGGFHGFHIYNILKIN
jgi:hypothetical protein